MISFDIYRTHVSHLSEILPMSFWDWRRICVSSQNTNFKVRYKKKWKEFNAEVITRSKWSGMGWMVNFWQHARTYLIITSFVAQSGELHGSFLQILLIGGTCSKQILTLKKQSH
jgi:hypothetical protein